MTRHRRTSQVQPVRSAGRPLVWRLSSSGATLPACPGAAIPGQESLRAASARPASARKCLQLR